MMEKRKFESMRAQMDKTGKYAEKNPVKTVMRASTGRQKELLSGIKNTIRTYIDLHDSMLKDTDPGSLKKLKYAVYFQCVDHVVAFLSETMRMRVSSKNANDIVKILVPGMGLNELIRHQVLSVKKEINKGVLYEST
jgi:hypothetical protein